MDEQPKSAILSGYRALDLTDEKGAFGARLLADMGAEVIRIEAPGEPPEGSRRSLEADLGKRSITLNLEAGEGREILKRLAQTADIVVESYSPGHLAGLGIGYQDLSQTNPGIIVASITGFGQDGPYRDYAADDLVASALGGQVYVNGSPEAPPFRLYGHQVYHTAGLFAGTGIMLALWHRHQTGRGQHVDISLQECAAAALDHVLVRYLYEGVIARRRGSLYWNNAFRVFPCRDGYILLSLLHQWETLVEWLDSAGMAEDLTGERWQDREYRQQHIAHVIEALERWTRSHTTGELIETGQLMRFPWARVTSIPELLESPQLRERDFFVNVEHPQTGQKCTFPATPCRLSRSPWRVGSRAPVPGEDNTSVYHGELGLSDDSIKYLERQGII